MTLSLAFHLQDYAYLINDSTEIVAYVSVLVHEHNPLFLLIKEAHNHPHT